MKEGFAMKPIIKKMLAGILALTMVLGAPIAISAEETIGDYVGVKQKTKETNDGMYVYYYTANTYVARTINKQLVNTPGIMKRAYTSGSVTITNAESKTVTASSDVSTSYNAFLWEVGAEAGVAYSVTGVAEYSTTVVLAPTAPEGVYYPYLRFPCYKTNFRVQRCNASTYTNWSTLYDITIEYAPRIDKAYVDLIKG